MSSIKNLRAKSLAENQWKQVFALDRKRELISGNAKILIDAVKRGADLRIYTEFRHNEHIDTQSSNPELVREVADFRITYLLDDRWVAGVINLRQPVALPDDFGPRPSMSFFLYNQNAEQAIARPYLDGKKENDRKGASPVDDHSDMPLYHQFDAWDTGTNAPSSNFVYDFDVYKFWVSDNWTEVYSHSSDGTKIFGSVEELEENFIHGREIKVAISGLCNDLIRDDQSPMPHEVFVHCGSCYYYTDKKQFSAASHPVVRINPAIPLRYKTEGWDFGWLIARSDGHLARLLVDPYTLKFHRSEKYHAMRWFVR